MLKFVMSAVAATSLLLATPIQAQVQRGHPPPPKVEFKTWEAAKKDMTADEKKFGDNFSKYKSAQSAYGSVFSAQYFPGKAVKLEAARDKMHAACSTAKNSQSNWAASIAAAQRFVTAEAKARKGAENPEYHKHMVDVGNRKNGKQIKKC